MSTTEASLKDSGADQPRDASGQFTHSAGVHALLDDVKVIATAAAEATEGRDPAMVGRRLFNRHREELGITRTPTAQGLEKRFDRRLSQIIRAALGDRRDIGHELGSTGPRDDYISREITEEQLVHPIKGAAFALDEIPTEHGYDVWVQDWMRKRERRGLLANPLPSSNTIIERIGSWPEALVLAGLIRRASDLAPMRRVRKRSEPAEVILDRCIDETGVLPSRRWFEEWCKRTDTSLGSDYKPWGATVERTRARRRAAGKRTPASETSFPQCPALPPQRSTIKRASRRWTDDEILDALRTVYGPEYLKGATPTQRHYMDASSGDDRLPSPTTIKKRFGPIQDAFRAAGL